MNRDRGGGLGMWVREDARDGGGKGNTRFPHCNLAWVSAGEISLTPAEEPHSALRSDRAADPKNTGALKTGYVECFSGAGWEAWKIRQGDSWDVLRMWERGRAQDVGRMWEIWRRRG